jgi:RNA polymerase sigma-70 factor (ECF subfamily)
MKVVAIEREALVTSPAAFAEFYDRAAPEVYRYFARSVLGNRATAEDLTQETFAAAALAARAGRPEALTLPWLMGIARHKLVDHYRHAARDERHLALVWSENSETVDSDLIDGSDPARVLEMLHDRVPNTASC